MAEEKSSKPAWASKTVGFNLAFASAMEIFPPFGVWVSSHPQTAVLLCAAGNYLIRNFTEGGLHYWKKSEKISA